MNHLGIPLSRETQVLHKPSWRQYRYLPWAAMMIFGDLLLLNWFFLCNKYLIKHSEVDSNTTQVRVWYGEIFHMQANLFSLARGKWK